MAQQTRKQQNIVERVMHDFKEGELEQRDGKPVESPKQAIAIALSEAGSSNRTGPAGNRHAPRQTEGRDTARATLTSEGKSRDALYAEAQRRDIPGRSKMTKAQLAYALKR